MEPSWPVSMQLLSLTTDTRVYPYTLLWILPSNTPYVFPYYLAAIQFRAYRINNIDCFLAIRILFVRVKMSQTADPDTTIKGDTVVDEYGDQTKPQEEIEQTTSSVDITTSTNRAGYSTLVVVTQTQTDTPDYTSASATSTATDSPSLSNSNSSEESSNESAQPKDSNGTGGLTAGTSAGIGVGVALGVLVLAFIAFFIYRRNQKRRRLAREDQRDMRSGLPELGTDGQKHELSTEEIRRAELGVDGQKHELPANVRENKMSQGTNVHELG